MLSLLRSDLYRAWHRADAFWTCLILPVAALCLLFGFACFLDSPLYSGFSAATGIVATRAELGLAPVAASPTYLLAQTGVGGGPLVLCAVVMTVHAVTNDSSSGFDRTILSGMRCRLAFAAEKVLLAGVYAAIVTLATLLACVAGLLLADFRFTDADPAWYVVAWVALVWLVTWATSVVVLLFTMATRSRLIGWAAILTLTSGLLTQVVYLVVFRSQALLGPEGAIRLADAITQVLPSELIARLSEGIGETVVQGACLSIDAAGMGHVALTAAGLIVVFGALCVLVGCRRDVA